MKVNLLLSEKGFFKERGYLGFKLFLTMVFSVLLVLAWHVALQRKVDQAYSQIDRLQAVLSGLASKTISKEQRQQKFIKSYMMALSKKKHRFTKFFNSVCRAISGDVYLDKIIFDNNKAAVIGKGRCIDNLRLMFEKLNSSDSSPVIEKINRDGAYYKFTFSW